MNSIKGRLLAENRGVPFKFKGRLWVFFSGTPLVKLGDAAYSVRKAVERFSRPRPYLRSVNINQPFLGEFDQENTKVPF